MCADPGDRTATTLYVRLAEAIANAKGVDVLDLDPLYHAIDAEAVAQVCTSADEVTADQPQVTFTAADCTVTVTADHTIDVVPQTATPADD